MVAPSQVTNLTKVLEGTEGIVPISHSIEKVSERSTIS